MKPMTLDEHEQFGKVIGAVTEMLSPYMERLWKGYGVNCKQAKHLQNSLHLIGSQLCNEMDKEWHKIIPIEHPGVPKPYYGPHKKAWLKP